MFSPSSLPRRAMFTPIEEVEEIKVLKKLNDYIMSDQIGSGSFSKVYHGYDTKLKRNVAIKRIKLKDLSRSSHTSAQLDREIAFMRQFNHNHILKLYEVLHDESMNYAYLVIEYAKNGSLGSYLNKNIHLSQKTIFSIMKQILSAIKFCHDKKIVHQDIKPSNILIDETGRAILADFGIGHSFHSAAMVVGSPAFQAPECLSDTSDCEEDEPIEIPIENEDPYQEVTHKISPNLPLPVPDSKPSKPSGSPPDGHHSRFEPAKEDIWSLGVTLYQLLFNRLPFEGSNLYEIIKSIRSTELSFPPDADQAIVELLKGMLSVDPSQRYTLEKVMNCPLIAEADDLAHELQTTNDTPDYDLFLRFNEKKGPRPPRHHSDIQPSQFQHIKVTVCPPNYSFKSVSMSIQTKLMYINSPYSPLRQHSSQPLPKGAKFYNSLLLSDNDEFRNEIKYQTNNPDKNQGIHSITNEEHVF